MDEWKSYFGDLRVETIRPSLPAALKDPGQLVEEELTGSGLFDFLEQATGERGSLTVLLNDPDRFTDSRLALEVVQRMARSGALDLRYRVLFATGSHLVNEAQKRRHEEAVLSGVLPDVVEIAWHDSRDPHLVRRVGSAELHHWVIDEENLLVIGSMEPHYFAGVTGAHKTLTVGVMSYQSIRDNHKNAMSPKAASFALEGNPVYDGIAAVARKLTTEGRRIFAVNEVLAGGSLVACSAGDPLEALAAGLPHVIHAFGRPLPGPVDLVVARVAPPLDKNLYQADKGIKNVETAVRDGGVILLEAGCRDGIGLNRFMMLMENAPTYNRAVELVQTEGYRLGDHKAVRLRALTDRRGVRLGIVSSGLSDEEAGIAGMKRFDNRRDAARWALGELADGKKTAALVEDAGNVTLSL